MTDTPTDTLPARTPRRRRRPLRMLAMVLLALMLLAVVALGAGFVWVQNANLAPYAISFVEKQTGLRMVAEGPLTIKLLPSPVLRAEKLTIPAFRGNEPLLSVTDADIQLAWGSGLTFWKGVTLQKVVMTDPVVYLVKPKSGPANWQPAPTLEAEDQPTDSETAASYNRSDKLPISSFGTIDVSNLNLTYIDEASGRRVVAKNVSLQADGTDLADATMALTGTINGQPLNGQGAFNFTNLANVPVKANLGAAGLKMAVDGELREQNAYVGALNVQTPNLKGTLDTLLGAAPPQAPASAFSLTGDVATGGDKLALKNFNAMLGDLLRATGNVDVTMGDTPSANGTFSASGSNLKQLVELATAQKQPGLPSAPFKVAATLSGSNQIKLDNFNVELVNLLTANGRATVVPGKAGELPQVDADVALRGGNLQALARAFGNNATLPAQSFSASAAVSGKGTYTVSDLTAQLSTLANLKGDFKVTPQPALQLAGSMSLKGNDLAAAAKAFGVSGNLPRSPFASSFTVGGKDRIEVSDLLINLPQLLEASGYLNFLPAAPHDVQGDLTFSRLNLDALGYCEKQTNGGASAETASTSAPPASETPWSDAPLPLDALRTITFKLDTHIKNLSCASFPATAAEVAVRNTASELNLSKLALSLPQGGSANVDMTLSHSGTPKLTLNLATQNLPLQQLVRTLADKGVVLPLNGTANLASSGASTRALAQNLAGNINFNATNGKLPYTRMLGNLSSVSSLLQGQLPQQNDDRITNMVAKYTVAGGTMTTDELTVTTPGLTLSGTGTVNLPAWKIDYTLTPKLAAAEGLNLPILIQGALGGPNIGPDKNVLSKFTGRITGEGIKSLLGTDKEGAKGIGGAVGDIIGGGGIKPENVQNLFNNFLGGKKAGTAAPAQETAPVSTPEPAAAETAPAATEAAPATEEAPPTETTQP